MKKYAYIRVSSTGQNEDRQVRSMARLNIPKAQIYMDKQSGKDFDRPAWQALIQRLKPGDLIYVASIDRLGRNYEEIQNQWRKLTKEQGVDIAVLDMPILDTRRGKDLMGTFLSDIVLQILSFVAQNERENIKDRQVQGIASARAKGIHLGRPKTTPPNNFSQVVKLWEEGEIPFSQALERTGLKQATFYNRLREYRGYK